MRKQIIFLIITLMFGLLTACGNGNSSTLVATSNNAITQAEITSSVSGKTLYFASTYPYLAPALTPNIPVTYLFGADGSLTKNGTLDGTWNFTAATGTITLTPASGTPVITLSRIQTESNYWLVSDSSNNYKISRLYTSGNLTAANTYLSSIFNSPLNTNFLMAGAIQTITPTKDFTANTISTYSTTGLGFIKPYAITTDRNGNLYVTDRTTSNTVKKIDTSGVVTQLASGFINPSGITCDGTYLYIVDSGNHVIYQMGIDGSGLAVIAGTAGTAGDVDAIGTNAMFNTPVGITNDGTNLYVADYKDYTIRKIQISNFSVTTLAGLPYNIATTNGYGTAARFNGPSQLTTDGSNLFVTEYDGRTVRKIVIATGQVTTLAGDGTYPGHDGTGTGASFYDPNGITTDGKFLYVTDYDRPYSGVVNSLVRRILITDGTVKTIGSGFRTPTGITTNGTSLYIADEEAVLINKMD